LPGITSGPHSQHALNNGWLGTVPDKGGWIPFLLCNPLRPILDRTCRPSEIQPV
jgi:hypothetical protein